MSQPLPLLTIAGSDSGGAAGLQADLKTWTALGGVGVYGMSAVTAVTAQNSERVVAVHTVPPEFVAAQIDAVLSDYGAAAIKTGFLGRVDIIEVVAERLAYWRDVAGKGGFQTRPYIIIDPVLVNHRGEAMFGPEVAAAYRHKLLPLADLITPNIRELIELHDVVTASPTVARARLEHFLADLGASRVLITGRGADQDTLEDLFWDGDEWLRLQTPRVETANLHGSGDTLSAAICAFVATGHDWPDAIRRAQAYTHAAIRRGAAWRLGAGHGPLGH